MENTLTHDNPLNLSIEMDTESKEFFDESQITLNKKQITEISYIKRLDINDFIKSSQIMISDYICSLCQGVYFDPIVDGCGHVFCRECFYTFNSNGKSNCPTTNLEIDLTLISSIKFVASILEKQTLHCKNETCEWLGRLSELPIHLNTECKMEKIKCCYENCLYQDERKNINNHEEICTYKSIDCILCHEKFILKDKNFHTKICKKEILACPQFCGILIERENFDSHIKEYCVNTEIDCFYFNYGCKKKLPKKEMKFHLLDDVSNHNLGVCKFLSEFKTGCVSKIEKIEKTLEENNEKFDEIYSFLENDLKKINNIILLNQRSNQEFTNLDSNLSKDDEYDCLLNKKKSRKSKSKTSRKDEENKNNNFNYLKKSNSVEKDFDIQNEQESNKNFFLFFFYFFFIFFYLNLF